MVSAPLIALVGISLDLLGENAEMGDRTFLGRALWVAGRLCEWLLWVQAV